MNLQKYTKHIYHLDMPWTFAEVVQRNGRGIRRGNQNDEININYVFARGTFDSLMYETVMNKKGWNEGLWSKEAGDVLKIDSEDSMMPSPAEMAISMEKDPIKQKQMRYDLDLANKKDEVNDLEFALIASKAEVNRLNSKISDYNIQIENANNLLKEANTKLTKEPKNAKSIKKDIQMYKNRIIRVNEFISSNESKKQAATKEAQLRDTFYKESKQDLEELKSRALEDEEIC